ncbi:MAG: DUF2147 domain-containing protein [Thermonemataceae bacterium]
MRKIGSLLLFAGWMLCSTLAVGQKADDIVGAWKTGEGTAIVAIKKSKSGKYFGRIVWLKEPNDENGKPKVDGKNPNESKRDRRLLGMVNLVGFEYVGDGKWEKGTIYDPKNGETYNCEIALEGENTLNVRGYIGVSLFGRTDVWTRQKKKG